ncbi:MAG: hypothetical protein ACREU3_18740, partial [Steroidobacteraceae bacterium]
RRPPTSADRQERAQQAAAKRATEAIRTAGAGARVRRAAKTKPAQSKPKSKSAAPRRTRSG